MRLEAQDVLVELGKVSDPGLDPEKQVNEDALRVAATRLGILAVVCDGMGGHEGGQRASQVAVKTVFDEMDRPADRSPRKALEQAIRAAGRAVHSIGDAAPERVRPGSTCVAVLVHREGAEVAHVGDSRAYVVSKGGGRAVTRDHSVVRELVDAGVITEADAPNHPEANRITRALGMQAEPEVEVRPEPVPLGPDDALVLATDGLTDLVTDEEIFEVVRKESPADGCEQLVALAKDRGGHDNVTAVILRRLADADATVLDPIEGQPEGDPAAVPLTHPGEPAPTVLQEPALASPAPTVIEPEQTLIEPPADPPRQIQATLPDAEPAPPPVVPAGRKGRALVWVGTLVAVGIVVAVVLWWLLGATP